MPAPPSRAAARAAAVSRHVCGGGGGAGGAARVSAEVSQALANGRAVVALESTIISHGMPFPENLETARAVERLVREGGAVPATVALIDGVPTVGLTDEQLVHLAKLGRDAAKTSTRDLPLVCAQGRTGATTVSATMALAARAGVRVFVTGGIGGVHRGAEQSFDISCDLTELGRTPVAVICAGAKSILDVPKTLEVLETNGVPVVTFGADQFPAFFTRDSGVRSPARVDDARQCGEMLRAMDALGMQSGALFAVPVPQEHEAGAEKVERATQQALAEAERLGVRGAETTPFVLKHVAEETGGDSLKANVALVKNNAAVGAAIAVEYARLRRVGGGSH